MIQDTKIVILEVVLAVFFVVIMMGMVGSAECKGMAERTSADFTDAINKVSADDFNVWTGEGMPPSEEDEYFESSSVH